MNIFNRGGGEWDFMGLWLNAISKPESVQFHQHFTGKVTNIEYGNIEKWGGV